MKYYVQFYDSRYDEVSKYGTAPNSVAAPDVHDTFEQAQEALNKRAQQSGHPKHAYRIRCGDSYTALHDCPEQKKEPDHQRVNPPANPKQAFGDKKAPVHLVPPSLVLEASLNMKDGAVKYGAYNYRNSKVEAMTYIGAIQRHTMAYLDGEDVDPESASGATHLGAIAACVAILTDARNKGMLIDNRPTKGTAGEVIRNAAGVDLTKKDPPA